jgi:stress response protein SCP2
MRVMSQQIFDLVVRRTWRVPLTAVSTGDAASIARRFDSVLLTSGFKASGRLLSYLGTLLPLDARLVSVQVLAVVQEAVGAHVQHNTYFRNFPRNVPDTLDFWVSCLQDALKDAPGSPRAAEVFARRKVDLLALPRYGRYQHTYEEMVAAHDTFLPALGDRRTVLDVGGSLDEEAHRLYRQLAGSTTPLSDADLAALALLAPYCAGMEQPATVPLRSARAIVNATHVLYGREPEIDTVTDVLRLACALSGGDVTLETATRFRSLPRPVRRTLLAALDALVRASPAKLGDVAVHREAWKRLGERLHPHEHTGLGTRVFAVARGEEDAPSLNARVERSLASGARAEALRLLAKAPGTLVRRVDHLLRSAVDDAERSAVVDALERALPAVSSRVVLGLREHLENRQGRSDQQPGAGHPSAGRRVFVNRYGGAWAVPDERAELPEDALTALARACDAEVLRRAPRPDGLVVDPDFLDVALPLSARSRPDGAGVLPRGSRTHVTGELLRFFVHWRQSKHTTDLDLSCLLLDRDFADAEHVSWTRLRGEGFVHSGDLTEAADGATELVDVNTSRIQRPVVVPTVYVYSGERFHQLAEGFFGFMSRDTTQAGLPFEPATVRMKSDLSGQGQVVIPAAFLRTQDGWEALWLHLNPSGRPSFNTVEEHRVTTTTLVRDIAARRYLTVRYLVGLLQADGVKVHHELPRGTGPVTYLGFSAPEDLPEGSRVVTPQNLLDLVPA